MQTSILEKYQRRSDTSDAEGILRKCVHCGFCLATCPTYNLLGDELDSPRGRIYLIKQVLEGHAPTEKTQLHLDRCLTCRNCETTCPSGVEYGHLVDIGRAVVEESVPRSFRARLLRRVITLVLPYQRRIGPLVKLGQAFAGVLPKKLRSSIPVKQDPGQRPTRQHDRKVLMLTGCVQPSMTPNTNAAASRVLDQLGIETIEAPHSGCCGAVSFHLNEQSAARQLMKTNIDAWWPAVEQGAEAILVTSSGCGVMVKDYAHLLKDDPEYSEKAAKISALAVDTSEAIAREDLSVLKIDPSIAGKIAFHPPCTLQHGQKLAGVTESLLSRLGFQLTSVPDSQECCGSAGTYSIFQPELSNALKMKKSKNLESGEPDLVVTANIGCQLHIQGGTHLKVKHWIELLDTSVESSSATPN